MECLTGVNDVETSGQAGSTCRGWEYVCGASWVRQGHLAPTVEIQQKKNGRCTQKCGYVAVCTEKGFQTWAGSFTGAIVIRAIALDVKSGTRFF